MKLLMIAATYLWKKLLNVFVCLHLCMLDVVCPPRETCKKKSFRTSQKKKRSRDILKKIKLTTPEAVTRRVPPEREVPRRRWTPPPLLNSFPYPFFLHGERPLRRRVPALQQRKGQAAVMVGPVVVARAHSPPVLFGE